MKKPVVLKPITINPEISTNKNLSSERYSLSPDDMWDCIKGKSENWGIEGYEIPKKYYDYHQVKWEKKRAEIIRAHKRVWPPPDWPKSKESEKQVPPIKKNFIDDQIKWANSFNDLKKSEELKESLKNRGTYKMPEPKKPLNLREKFLEDEKKKKEKFDSLPKIQPWKENAIEEAKKNLEEAKSKIKTDWQKNIERYPKEKPQWPRSDRVTVLDEAVYIGERLPFYSSGKDQENNKGKDEQLFYPKKEITWKRAPSWSFRSKSPIKLPTEQMVAKEEAIKNKVENLMNSRRLTDKDLIIDVIASHDKIRKRGRYYVEFKKPFDYANTEQYKLNKEQRPSFSPGPQHYWKMKEGDVNERPKDLVEDKEVNGKSSKVYYMNHKRTDFRTYKPMRKSVF